MHCKIYLAIFLVHIYNDIFDIHNNLFLFLFLMQMKHLLLKRINANINNTIFAILFSTKNDVTKISIKKDIAELNPITFSYIINFYFAFLPFVPFLIMFFLQLHYNYSFQSTPHIIIHLHLF